MEKCDFCCCYNVSFSPCCFSNNMMFMNILNRKIKSIVVLRQLRLKDFVSDFDRHFNGKITANQLRRALVSAGILP